MSHNDHLGAVEYDDEERCPECDGRGGYHFHNCIYSDPEYEEFSHEG